MRCSRVRSYLAPRFSFRLDWDSPVRTTTACIRTALLLALGACFGPAQPCALALSPHKSLTQYTHTVWTQEHGLPQDSIRAIAQTSDGYLWLGTDEGLARFDGYEFAVFTKARGHLPSNAITWLSAAPDGALWIGTPNGLACYRDKKFVTYTTKDGLPDNSIASVYVDHSGAVWAAAGIVLSRFQDGRFSNYGPQNGLSIQTVRIVYGDRDRNLWVAGFGGVAKLVDGKFAEVIGAESMGGNIVTSMLKDRQGNIWVAGSKGLLKLSPDGKLRSYGAGDGLPDPFVRSLWEDRDGNLWAGTNGGLCRLEGGRFSVSSYGGVRDTDWVRCILEDREGDLWVGMNSGLNRYRDDPFTMFTRSEGLPSNEPTVVYQDRSGGIWVGFHDAGLLRVAGGERVVHDSSNGLPSREVFAIREARDGDLLVATREGLSRIRGGHSLNYIVQDEVGRRLVFDVLEDTQGRLWVATPGGLKVLRHEHFESVLPGAPLLNDAFVVLTETRDGALWAGTYGKGLYRIKDGQKRLYGERDGLSSLQIRALLEDRDGSLWIGTFGGGLNLLSQGNFTTFTAQDGLLSDNISHVEDDGQGSLWLSTTRGICRVSKQQLKDFAAGSLKALTPLNYGVEDGLRSAQCAPGYPTGGGGTRSTDGRLWFPTTTGLAVLDPSEKRMHGLPPAVHLSGITADGKEIDLDKTTGLGPGEGRLQFRYTAIHLAAPEQVRYQYRLEGLDKDYQSAGARRTANYNSLNHGHYRFVVKASLPDGASSEASYAFQLLPHFHETSWFLYLCAALASAAIWGIYRLRLRQIQSRFNLVLEERARLAREIHDTLAQGFVGLSSQLDAVAAMVPREPETAKKHLELARKMARHSVTEARRSVQDLRASALEGQDLSSALETAARQWTAGSPVQVEVDASGGGTKLPQDAEQHLLRIAQEAVTNAVKHAGAAKIRIRLRSVNGGLRLSVEDDGRGFDLDNAFSALGGHFGLLGMRERAERLGGKLDLKSESGKGTRVEVTVPLS
jgi:signal transduction histidine kinase/ligand-binding sensor domain-containing protein